jgi:hypothetical protein
MIAIGATLANADGWEDSDSLAEGKKQSLKRWLALPNGIPSDDPFKRVFEGIDADGVQQRFMDWVQAVFTCTAGQGVAIEGKGCLGRATKAETQYYISPLPALASLVCATIRAHWGIENGCHWVLDGVFREDAARTRVKNAADKLALLRKIALNLIRPHPAKGSLKGKRDRAALNEAFLLKVMRSSFHLML